MDWANERYVRVYTRDSTTWKLLDWRGRMVLQFMIRKVNRAGVLEVDGHGVMGLAAVIEVPIDIVEEGIKQLTDPRIATVIATPTAYVIPNFLEAQEAVQTPAHRSREYRARQRDTALLGVTKRDGTVTKRDDESEDDESPPVTKRDAGVTKRDGTVTKTDSSPEISSLRSDPIRSDPEDLYRSPRAIPPSTEPVPVRGELPPRERGQLAEATYARVSAARVEEGRRLGIANVLPFPEVHPGRHPASFTDLQARIREEGINAVRHCDVVIANLIAQARETGSIEWLAEKSFTVGGWRTARNWQPGQQRAGPRFASRETKPEPPPVKVPTYR